MPESITSIGYCSFYRCEELTSITIPASVTSITNYAFGGCIGLETMTVAAGNSVYHSAGNCIIETATGTLVFGCKNSVIPTDGSVSSIGRLAFANMSTLTSISIPQSVTSIDIAAFASTGLTSIVIPSGITTIPNEMCSNCTNLQTVTIPVSVTKVEGQAFSLCSALETVYYKGSAEQWAQVSVSYSNDPLTAASIVYNA